MSNRSRIPVRPGSAIWTRTAGFTLLEAIVAVAIIGLALVPIVSFISTSTNALIKAAEANDRSFAMQNVIAMMDSVNPSTDGDGSLPLSNDVSVEWTSTVIIPPGATNVVTNTGLPTRNLGFYNVHVIVSRSSEQWFAFDLRKVGYVEPQPFGNTSTDMK